MSSMARFDVHKHEQMVTEERSQGRGGRGEKIA